MGFGVRVVNRSGVPVLAPSGVRLAPTGWSAAALGGPVACEVEVTGDPAALLGLATWLGYGLEVVDEAGGVVWWGQVTGLEVAAGGVRRGLAIGDVVNRVKLLYVRQTAGGEEEAAETAWSEDATSVSLYDVRERVFTAGTLTDGEAAAIVAMLLARLSRPQRSVRLEGGAGTGQTAGGEGRLTGRGWFGRLDDVYYVNVAGLEEHNPGNGEAIPVGLGFTSAYLAFVDADTPQMHEIFGQLSRLGDYDDIMFVVSSTLRNNGLYQLLSGDSRDAVAYASTFGFEPNDDLFDNVNSTGLEFIATDDIIWVEGTAYNDEARRVKTAGSSHIEVSPGWNSGYNYETSAATIYRGTKITMNPQANNEAPNGVLMKTITVYGQRVYQGFGLVADTEWAVDRIELRVRKVGAPTDSLRVGLYTDGGGTPGTLIEQVTVAGSALAGEVGWVAFTLATAPTVEYGTGYGIQVDRTGAMDALNFYEVEIDPEAGYGRGALVLFDGTAWQAPIAQDLIFRVVGAVNALDMATAVVSQAGTEIGRTVMEATTGVEAWQYAQGEETAGAVLRRLLEMGDSSGRRLLATVTPDRALRVAPQGDDYLAWLRLVDGRPGWLDGTPLQAGVLPVGVWMELGDAPLLSEAWAGLDRVFVARASYRVGQGWEIEAEGQRSVVERLGVQMG